LFLGCFAGPSVAQDVDVYNDASAASVSTAVLAGTLHLAFPGADEGGEAAKSGSRRSVKLPPIMTIIVAKDVSRQQAVLTLMAPR